MKSRIAILLIALFIPSKTLDSAISCYCIKGCLQPSQVLHFLKLLLDLKCIIPDCYTVFYFLLTMQEPLVQLTFSHFPYSCVVYLLLSPYLIYLCAIIHWAALEAEGQPVVSLLLSLVFAFSNYKSY